MAVELAAWARRLELPPERLTPLAEALAALQHPLEVEHGLERLLEGPGVAAALRPALTDALLSRALVRLAYAAPFLLRHLQRHPQRLSGRVQAGLEGDGALLPFRDYCPPQDCPGSAEAAVMTALRRFKYDNYLRITARDLLGLQDTAATCRMISALADTLIRLAYRYAFAQQARRRGLPLVGGRPAAGLVIGMGKLGGQELNYASDVDLIFLHSGEGAFVPLPEGPLPPIDPDEPAPGFWARWEALADAAPRVTAFAGAGADAAGVSSDEFHNQVVRQVARLLSLKTEDGFGFRVDVDLRPMGRAGQLCPSIGLVEQYYLVHGREWERTAMVKARPVDGDPGLWSRLQETLRPFVYRRYLDFGAVEGIALIKHDINRQHRAVLENNLKLGSGGIRENEFFVQAQQLLHGGRKPELQVTNHAEAVGRLVAAGLLSAEEGQAHLADYWCLRTRENRLQMVDEAQAQELPELPAERTRVFQDFAPGFERRQEAAEAALATARERTAQRFAGLFRGTGEEEYPQSDVWQAAVREHLPPGEVESALDRINALMSSLMRTRMGERCVFKLSRLLTLPALYRRGTDAAFLRWLEFAEQIGNRSMLYSLIEANPTIVDWIGLIFREGGVHAQQLIRHPEYLETFLSLTGSGPGGMLPLLQSLRAQARDEEEFILDLQATKSQLAIQILTSYLHDPESRGHRRLLTELADATIHVCAQHAWQATVARWGVPQGARDAQTIGGCAVLAMGKLGSREMHFSSDLDLVFLYAADGMTSSGRSHFEFYGKFVQKLNSLLTSQTQFGRLFELDHRLRPFGAKGLLVPSLAAYRSFLAAEAEVWNFQALTRIRHLTGTAALSQALLAATARAWRARAMRPREVVAQVRHMLARLVQEHSGDVDPREALPLKYAVGGMIGFEFARQCHFLVRRLGAHAAPDDDAAAAACWTPPGEHEMIEDLLPLYLEISDLDERLALHTERFDHRATATMFDALAAVRERWRFADVHALMQRLEQGVLQAFDALEAE